MFRPILIAALVMGLTTHALAQSSSTKATTKTDKWFTATAPDNGKTPRFYGKDGSSAGRAETSDKTTRFYGRDGSSAGHEERSGSATRFHAKDGSSAGRAETSGTTTRFYN